MNPGAVAESSKLANVRPTYSGHSLPVSARPAANKSVRSWHRTNEPGYELQRFENDMGGSFTVRNYKPGG